MLNVSKLLKMAGIAMGTMIITVSVFGDWWCNHCNRNHNGNRCPAETIGAANHPYACNDQAYGCGYDCNPYANGYDQGRMQGYNEAYRNFNCLQWFNEWECEGWDSDDEEEYVRQAEERARELRRRRNHHHAQSEARRRQQTVDNIYQINSLDDLQTILHVLYYHARDLGLQIRGTQIVRPGFNPCGGYDPYGCNEMNHYDYNCHDNYGYHCNPYDNYDCGYGCRFEMDQHDYNAMEEIRRIIQQTIHIDMLEDALGILNYYTEKQGLHVIELDGDAVLLVCPLGTAQGRPIPIPEMWMSEPNLIEAISKLCERGLETEIQAAVDIILERARNLGFSWVNGKFR